MASLDSWLLVVGVGDEYLGCDWRNGVLIFLSGNTKVLSRPFRTRKFTVTLRIQKFDSHIYEGSTTSKRPFPLLPVSQSSPAP